MYPTEQEAFWERLPSSDCDDSFAADALRESPPRICWENNEKHDGREPGFSKEEFRCSEMLFHGSKTYCGYEFSSNKLKFIRKGLNERILEQSGDESPERYGNVVDDAVKFIAANRSFRSKDHAVATYEQTTAG